MNGTLPSHQIGPAHSGWAYDEESRSRVNEHARALGLVSSPHTIEGLSSLSEGMRPEHVVFSIQGMPGSYYVVADVAGERVAVSEDGSIEFAHSRLQRFLEMPSANVRCQPNQTPAIRLGV